MAVIDFKNIPQYFYWIALFVFIIVLVLMWIFIGRRPEIMNAKFSLHSPILAAAAPAEQAGMAAAAAAAACAQTQTQTPPSPRLTKQEFAPYPKKGTRDQVLKKAGVTAERDIQVLDVSPVLPPDFKVKKSKSDVKKREDSYYQKLTQQIAERVFNTKFQTNVRPSWMRNPVPANDGKHHNLELDLYCDKLKIAIEYNGAQHYIFPSFMFPNTNEGRAKFLAQRARDEAKLDLCDARGVYLITVPHVAHEGSDKPEECIEAWLRYYHPQEEMKRQKERAINQEKPNQAIIETEEMITQHSLD